jgi:TonB family protein
MNPEAGMRNLMTVAAFILAANCFIGPEALSQPLAYENWWKFPSIVNKLELKDAQVADIERSHVEQSARIDNLALELDASRKKLEDLLKSEDSDDAGILEQAQRAAEKKMELDIARTERVLSLRKQLNREQKASLIRLGLEGFVWEKRGYGPDGSLPGNGKKIYSPGEGIQDPVLLEKTLPRYTEAARNAGIEGKVVLEAIVRGNGSLDNFKVLHSLGYGLDEAAVYTVARKWKYSPGMLDGKPVDVKMRIEVEFRLR